MNTNTNVVSCPVCGTNCHKTFALEHNPTIRYALEHGGDQAKFFRALGIIVTVCIETAHNPSDITMSLDFLDQQNGGVKICRACAVRIAGFKKAAVEYVGHWHKNVRTNKARHDLQHLGWHQLVAASKPDIDLNRFTSYCLHLGETADPWQALDRRQVRPVKIDPNVEDDQEALTYAERFWHNVVVGMA